MMIFTTFITHERDVNATLKAGKPTGPTAEAVQLLPNIRESLRPTKLCFLSLAAKDSAEARKVFEYCKLVGIEPACVVFLDYRHNLPSTKLDNLRDFAKLVDDGLERYAASLADAGAPSSTEWLLFLERSSMLISWAFFHFALAKRRNSKLLAISKQGASRSIDALGGLELSADLMTALERQQASKLDSIEADFNPADASPYGNVIMEDPSTKLTYAKAERIARMRESDGRIPSVLILGESGVGKEALAQFIHVCSRKAAMALTPAKKGAKPGDVATADKPVTMNCAGLSEQLADSLLFGHCKGAFTGATKDHQGLIDQAQGGTLFLDEVADLEPRVQAKLLRVLQERKFNRLGNEGTLIPCDKVRFIFATCQTSSIVPDGTSKQKVRRDLFERIAQYQLTLLPLRDRPRDLGARIKEILEEYSQIDNIRYCVSNGTLERLVGIGLDGNYRELERRFCEARLHFLCSVDSKTRPGDKDVPLNLFLFEDGSKPSPKSKPAAGGASAPFSLELTPQQVFAVNQGTSAPYPLKEKLSELGSRFRQELYVLTKSKPLAAKMLGLKSHNSIL